MDPSPELTVPKRPAGLAFAIALLAFVSVFGLAKAVFGRDEFLAEFPELTPALLDAMMAIVVAVLGCLVAIWFGRKWGVRLGLVLVACELALEIYIGAPWLHVLRWPVAVALVASYVRPIWSSFR